MRNDRARSLRNLFLAIGLAIGLAIPACAPAAGQGIQDLLGQKGTGAAEQTPIQFDASLERDGQSDVVILRISAKLAPDHWTYAVTSGDVVKPGIPTTKITVKPTPGLEEVGKEFEPDHPPKEVHDPNIGGQVE